MKPRIHPYILTLGKNFTVQGLCRMLAVAAGIVSTSLLTRTLGPEGYGRFTGVLATVSLIGLVADAGLNIYATGELGKDRDAFFRHFRSVLAVKGGAVAVFVLIALIVSLVILTGPGQLPLALLAIPALAVGYGASFGIAILTGLFRVIEATLTDTIGRLISLGILVVLLTRIQSPAVPFIAMFLANAAIFVRLVSRIKAAYPAWGKADTGVIRRIVVSVFPLLLGMAWTVAYMKIDTVILVNLRPSAEVGVYGLAYTVLEQLLAIWGLYMMTAFPHLSRSHKDGGGERTLARERLVAVAVSVSSVVGILLIGDMAIRLVAGPKFAASMPLLSILVLAIPIFAQNNLSYHWLIVRGRQRLVPWIYGAAFILNVILNLILIPQYGAVAAAWMTVATEAFVAAGYLVAEAKGFSPLARVQPEPPA